MNSRNKENFLSILCILVMVLVFGIPYYQKGFVQGGDGSFHMARIASLVASIKTGVFPPKIRPILMKSYGYAVGIFYPDFFLYFPAAIKALFHLDVFMAWKIYFFIFLFVTGIVNWKCITKLTDNRFLGIFGALIYIGANAWLWDFSFCGGRVGTIHSMMFIMLTIIGLILSLRDDKKGYLIYGVGLISTLLSHHLDFTMLMLFIFVYIILSFDVVIKNYKILLRIIGVSFIDLFASTAYWLPAMEQAADQKMKALYDNIYEAKDNIFLFSRFYKDLPMLPYTIMYLLSVVLFIGVCVYKKKVSKDAVKMNIMLIFFVWFTTSHFIWEGIIGEALSFFQYTYRIMAINEALFVLAIIFNLQHIYNCMQDKFVNIKSPYYVGLAVSMVIALASYPVLSDMFTRYLSITHIDEHELLYDRYNGAAGQEWLPVETQSFALTSPETAKADDGSGADGVKYDDGKWFDVWLLMDKEYYDMPYVYYKGYHAYLLGDDNEVIEELKVGKAEEDNGLLRVFIPKDHGEIGHVMVTYRKIAIQKISYVISFITVISLMVCFVLEKRRLKGSLREKLLDLYSNSRKNLAS
ncbi:MAG: hypothetical protein J5802_14590 [Butyrivibrio sp.]|nr:hypothetical protein [Butyrivibrio sp.]